MGGGDVGARTWFWRPKILNYPVQGTGADLVAIGRVTMWKRLNKVRNSQYPLLFVSTVHDSIDIDVHPWYNIGTVCGIINSSIEDISTNFERLFKVPFNLPVTCEIGYGRSLAELTVWPKPEKNETNQGVNTDNVEINCTEGNTNEG